VLWPGIDLRPFSPDGPRDVRLARLESPVVFHPARLLRWKGVETGLEAFILLRRRLGRGSLVLCASENVVDDDSEVELLRRELVARAQAAGVHEHVAFLAFERERIAAAYRASDVVWYPTVDDEPFGLVPLEAMASGAPLVVSDSGGMRETVLAGKTALVVPRGRPDALAKAAERLVRDRVLRDRLADGGLRRSRRFDLGRFAGQLEAVYRSAVAP
jgi:glycosyltransferase involved in cell wall biosynthesis